MRIQFTTGIIAELPKITIKEIDKEIEQAADALVKQSRQVAMELEKERISEADSLV